jgi:hypothetical protein
MPEGDGDLDVIRLPPRSKPVLGGALLLALVATLAGCGGGGSGSDAAVDATFGETTSETSTTGSAETAGVDPSAVPAPGQARVEVDGKVFVLESSGSIHFVCDVASDEIRINYQQTEAGDLLFQASRQSGEWLGNVTFAESGNNYGGSVPRSGDGLAVGTDVLTFSGTLTHRTYSDPTNTRDVEASIAVNCDTSGAGGSDPTAEIDGRTFVFPASGAQSFDCEVAPTGFRVIVNRLALEDSQIQIEGTQQSGDWVGAASVISGEDRYIATFPLDGTGLEVDGNTVTFTGTFTQTSESDPTLERDVEGTASATCP